MYWPEFWDVWPYVHMYEYVCITYVMFVGLTLVSNTCVQQTDVPISVVIIVIYADVFR